MRGNRVMHLLCAAAPACAAAVAAACARTVPVAETRDAPGGPVIVDAAPGAGEYPSLARGADGALWVAYHDAEHADLKVAHRAPDAAGRWSVVTVDEAGRTGLRAAAAVTPDGVPHVAYVDADRWMVKHAWFTSGAWATEPVDQGENVGLGLRALVDHAGTLRLFYYDAASLRAAEPSPPGWKRLPIEERVHGDVSTTIGAAAAPDGRAHVTFYDYDAFSGRMKLAAPAGGLWTTAVVDQARGAGVRSAVAFETGGRPLVAYVSVPEGNLLVGGFGADGGFASARLARYVYGIDAASTAAGEVVLAYTEAASEERVKRGALRVARLRAGRWSVSRVAGAEVAAGHLALSIDAAGRAAVAFHDAAARTLALYEEP